MAWSRPFFYSLFFHLFVLGLFLWLARPSRLITPLPTVMVFLPVEGEGETGEKKSRPISTREKPHGNSAPQKIRWRSEPYAWEQGGEKAHVSAETGGDEAGGDAGSTRGLVLAKDSVRIHAIYASIAAHLSNGRDLVAAGESGSVTISVQITPAGKLKNRRTVKKDSRVLEDWAEDALNENSDYAPLPGGNEDLYLTLTFSLLDPHNAGVPSIRDHVLYFARTGSFKAQRPPILHTPFGDAIDLVDVRFNLEDLGKPSFWNGDLKKLEADRLTLETEAREARLKRRREENREK